MATYDRLIAEFLASGRRTPGSDDTESQEPVLVEILARYWTFCRGLRTPRGWFRRLWQLFHLGPIPPGPGLGVEIDRENLRLFCPQSAEFR